jgi:hypothetical protein
MVASSSQRSGRAAGQPLATRKEYVAAAVVPRMLRLDWNHGCIASVRRDGDFFVTRIDWGGRTHFAKAGSLVQGVRWVSRWVDVRKGPPSFAKRSVISNKGWSVDGCGPAKPTTAVLLKAMDKPTVAPPPAYTPWMEGTL